MPDTPRSRYRAELDNPFAAPEADLSAGAEGREVPDDAEQIRREYQRHEANVKSVGLLQYLGAIVCGILSFGLLMALPRLGSDGRFREEMRPFFVGMTIGFGLFAVVNAFLGYGLRRFRNGARWTVVVLTSIGALMYGIGTLRLLAQGAEAPEILGNVMALLISVYILSILTSPKNAMVFSPEYQAIIAETPHIKTGTSLVVKVLLAVVGGLVLLGVLAALLANR